MIITIDTETQGLNAQKFIMGCICHENLKTETFRDKRKMYSRIIELAESAKRSKGRLSVYAHNLQYDYLSIGAYQDKRNVIFSTGPFIVDTMIFENGRQDVLVKWIDTLGLWRGDLASLGESIGYPKSETPEWLKQDTYEPHFGELAIAEGYMERDAKVLMHYILKLRKKLWDEGVNPRMIITTSQISMSYFTKHLQEHEEPKDDGYYDPQKHYKVQQGKWLIDIAGGVFYPELYPDNIYAAYRGGRVQAFQTGYCAEATCDDINSLYPSIAANMRFPDIRTEKKIYNPLEKGWSRKDLFEQIGVSECIVLTPREKGVLGYLPVRIEEGVMGVESETSIYPETDDNGRKTLVGTWTHLELQRALELGYECISINWSITWADGENPFQEFMLGLYEKRKRTNEKFDNNFYKLMMNGLLGKFGQHRDKKEVTKIDVEELPIYRANGWEPIGSYGTDLIVQRTLGIDYKKNHCPIIPTLVTAGARDKLYDYLQIVKRENLWYCDTDSIIYDSSEKNRFKYDDNLGGWKNVHERKELLVYGKKKYRIGEDIKLSRIPKRYITKEAFDAGTITYEDIIGVKQTNDENILGTRIQHTRELKEDTKEETPNIIIDTKTTLTEQLLQKIKETGKKKINEAKTQWEK